jgi:hypothetical protein
MSEGPGDWTEWGRHVLLELERLGNSYEELRDNVEGIRRDIRELKTRAAIYGCLAGMLASGTIVVIAKFVQ